MAWCVPTAARGVELVGFGAVGRPLATLATAAGIAIASLIGSGCGVNSGVAPPGGADLNHGKQLFTATCGGCHTLAEAGTKGTIGPNLDEAKPDAQRVIDVVTHGKGVMPPFGKRLLPAQIRHLAAFVSVS